RMSLMLVFGGFVAAALALRRNREAHKRLMLLACVSILGAAIARIPGLPDWSVPAIFSSERRSYVEYALTLLFVVAAMMYDFVSRKEVHKVYILGGTLFAICKGALEFF